MSYSLKQLNSVKASLEKDSEEKCEGEILNLFKIKSNHKKG